MVKSESIKSLAKALTMAQREIVGAKLDSTNPFFKSKYADLTSVVASCKEPLAKNGLSVTQILGRDEQGDFVETCLLHESGEYLMGRLYLQIQKKSMQDLGSAITYARRYSLMAIVGIAPEDDDAETTMNRPSGPQKVPSRSAVPPQGASGMGQVTEGQLKAIYAICKKGGWDMPQDVRSWRFDKASAFIKEHGNKQN